MGEIDNTLAINIQHVSKQYILGQYGYKTLRQNLQTWNALRKGKEDPNSKIGTQRKTEGKPFFALEDINLKVHRGQALGIIGCNGSGKSTLLKLLSQVTAPTYGQIELFGRVSSMLEVGTGFNREMTGRENIYLNGAILGMTKKEIDSKMEQIIDFSEVREFIDTPVKRYSSGMYVKLAFSVAAHLDSEILIMDEVLAVGDVAFQRKCLDRMSMAAKEENRTVLYVSHNMETIQRLCDSCVVLNAGHLVFEGNVDQAIEYYMGTEDSLYAHKVFKDEEHEQRFYSKKFNILEYQLLDKTVPEYRVGEKITFKIKYIARENLKGVYMHFIVLRGSAKVGSSFAKDTFSFEKGEERWIEFEFDTCCLPEGQYTMMIVAHATVITNGSDNLDIIPNGFQFRVKYPENDLSYHVWRKSWGLSRLPGMIVR